MRPDLAFADSVNKLFGHAIFASERGEGVSSREPTFDRADLALGEFSSLSSSPWGTAFCAHVGGILCGCALSEMVWIATSRVITAVNEHRPRADPPVHQLERNSVRELTAPLTPNRAVTAFAAAGIQQPWPTFRHGTTSNVRPESLGEVGHNFFYTTGV